MPKPAEPAQPAEPAKPAGRGGPPTTVRLAALVTAIEGVALVGLGLFYAVKIAVDRPDSYGRAVFGALFVLAGGALLLLLGRGLLRVRGWARSPVVVLQILALPIGYSLAFQAGLPGYGGPILVLAAAELYLLFTPDARAAFWG